jgi:beta-phosphoglucomutase-like phosphatase (HAD superfamily)
MTFKMPSVKAPKLGDYDAFAWDCDGTAMDSEFVSCSIAAAMLTENQYPISIADFLVKFMGKNIKHIVTDIDAERGNNDFSTNFDYEELSKRQMKGLLKVVEIGGATALMTEIERRKKAQAIASGADLVRLRTTLTATGQIKFFKNDEREHIYSSPDMLPAHRGKPHGDIFKMASENLGVPPERCLAFEDGVNGILAAKDAGMKVCAVLGGSHMTPALIKEIMAAKPDYVVITLDQVLNPPKLTCRAKSALRDGKFRKPGDQPSA